ILLILAWKVAGYYGVDAYLLPALGTPWKPGKAFTPNRGPVPV
ncbi:MAG: DoxX family protein, partial [Armatimonadetes bacterium]|nr:DoxX family protein [Armatimonadota bacterium]